MTKYEAGIYLWQVTIDLPLHLYFFFLHSLQYKQLMSKSLNLSE